MSGGRRCASSGIWTTTSGCSDFLQNHRDLIKLLPIVWRHDGGQAHVTLPAVTRRLSTVGPEPRKWGHFAPTGDFSRDQLAEVCTFNLSTIEHCDSTSELVITTFVAPLRIVRKMLARLNRPEVPVVIFETSAQGAEKFHRCRKMTLPFSIQSALLPSNISRLNTKDANRSAKIPPIQKKTNSGASNGRSDRI